MTKPSAKKTVKGKPLSTICFTGKMPEKRTYYENLAIKQGLQPVDDVSTNLSILVAA